MELWTLPTEMANADLFSQLYGRRVISGNGRLEVWKRLYEINPAAMTLIVEELGASDRSGFDDVLEFLRDHSSELDRFQQEKMENMFCREVVLASLGRIWPEAYLKIANELPDDLIHLAEFASEDQAGSQELLALQKLAHELPNAAHSNIGSPETMEARRLLAKRLPLNVIRFFQVGHTYIEEGVHRDYQGIAKWSLILMDKLSLRSDRVDKTFQYSPITPFSNDFANTQARLRKKWGLPELPVAENSSGERPLRPAPRPIENFTFQPESSPLLPKGSGSVTKISEVRRNRSRSRPSQTSSGPRPSCKIYLFKGPTPKEKN